MRVRSPCQEEERDVRHDGHEHEGSGQGHAEDIVDEPFGVMVFAIGDGMAEVSV